MPCKTTNHLGQNSVIKSDIDCPKSENISCYPSIHPCRFYSRITLSTLILLFIHSFGLFAQEPEEVDPMPIRLKAQILNLDDDTPVSRAYIFNFRTHSGIIADENGRFMMDMLNIDSLSISSLGFSKVTVRIPANYNQLNLLTLYAKPIQFSIPQINVQGVNKKVNFDGVPVGKKLNIDAQLRGDAYNEKPPVIAAFFNPASYLQYYISKREREKREVRQAIITEKHWQTLSEFYTQKLVMKLTGLNDSTAEKLMIYINSKGLLSQMTNEYDVRKTIQEQYKIFREEGH
jgi:hypothetical protein